MAGISQKTIDQVNTAADITDVISRYIDINRNNKALCPFHDDTKPSLSILPERQIFNCFTCGKKGGTIQFIMFKENVRYPQAIEVLANKGIVGDRHFNENNDPSNQITLIEQENVDYYNSKYSLNIPYIDFRRNIVTKGIKLNDLINKKISVGNVKLQVVDLCRPCKHLQEKLKQNNIIKEFLRKGGIRCQILTTSQIKIGDNIKLID